MQDPDWHSFWDVADPRQGARVLVELCGDRAKLAAAVNALAARSDGRASDRRFWVAVLCRLYGRDLDDHFRCGARPRESRRGG